MSQRSTATSTVAEPDGLFIISTNNDKFDGQTRKSIRSHVMRGKNTRQSRYMRLQLRQKQGTEQSQTDTSSSEQSQSEYEEKRARGRDNAVMSRGQPLTLAAPRPIASEMSLFAYQDEMHPYMLNLIRAAFTVVKPDTYNLESVLLDGVSNDQFHFSDFPNNPALLHTLLFHAQSYRDGKRIGDIAHAHHAKALQYLQKDLLSSHAATLEGAMMVVVSLAIIAISLGDMESTLKHMDGLSRMIELRGGLKALRHGSVTEHKATRLDFGVAMTFGTGLRYLRNGEPSWGPQLARGVDVIRLPELSMIQPRPDPRLLNIWADLRVFSREANEATKTGIMMPQEIFINLKLSCPSRLVDLRDEFDPTSFPEMLRLCMLAFMKGMFVQIPGYGARMIYLLNGLENVLKAQTIRISTPGSPSTGKLLFWALFMSAISIFEDLDRNEWLWMALRRTMTSLGLRSWPMTRTLLKRFLWIDVLHDPLGKHLYDQWLGRPRTKMRVEALDDTEED